MNTPNFCNLSTLMQKVINRITSSGAGSVIITDDGHIFVEPCTAINAFWGAIDMKKEAQLYGERIIVRKVKKRAKRSKYAGMPRLQLYSLPVLKKNAGTMTPAEQMNMQMNTRALRMAHAVERDPEQLATYRELHEEHIRNPQGYKRLYSNFFGFLVATFRMQLEAEKAALTDGTAALTVQISAQAHEPSGSARPEHTGTENISVKMPARMIHIAQTTEVPYMARNAIYGQWHGKYRIRLPIAA